MRWVWTFGDCLSNPRNSRNFVGSLSLGDYWGRMVLTAIVAVGVSMQCVG